MSVSITGKYDNCHDFASLLHPNPTLAYTHCCKICGAFLLRAGNVPKVV